MFERSLVSKIIQRLNEPRRFIQVIVGPRQVGKTTAIRSALRKLSIPSTYFTCDEPDLHDRFWIQQRWDSIRLKVGKSDEHVVVIDEIQKVPQWSETVKSLADQDSQAGVAIKPVILGSSPLLVRKGLTESLAGRFEIIYASHWSYPEMRDAFGWDSDAYILFGGYPGTASLIGDPERWRNYVTEALVEATISKDIFQMERVEKPALLKQLFHLGVLYSGQIVSYQKLTGQLQDAGNTTTLAHYLSLLEHAGLLTGLQKYSGSHIRKRASSPKLHVLNTALMTSRMHADPSLLRADPLQWGRLVESSVGAHLYNNAVGKGIEVLYWRQGNFEVDFILVRGDAIVAVEVKSGRRREELPGMEVFCGENTVSRRLVVGQNGMPVEEFLSIPIERLF